MKILKQKNDQQQELNAILKNLILFSDAELSGIVGGSEEVRPIYFDPIKFDVKPEMFFLTVNE